MNWHLVVGISRSCRGSVRRSPSPTAILNPPRFRSLTLFRPFSPPLFVLGTPVTNDNISMEVGIQSEEQPMEVDKTESAPAAAAAGKVSNSGSNQKNVILSRM